MLQFFWEEKRCRLHIESYLWICRSLPLSLWCHWCQQTLHVIILWADGLLTVEIKPNRWYLFSFWYYYKLLIMNGYTIYFHTYIYCFISLNCFYSLIFHRHFYIILRCSLFILRFRKLISKWPFMVDGFFRLYSLSLFMIFLWIKSLMPFVFPSFSDFGYGRLFIPTIIRLLGYRQKKYWGWYEGFRTVVFPNGVER